MEGELSYARQLVNSVKSDMVWFCYCVHLLPFVFYAVFKDFKD
jgi:hypothetical protein